MTYSQLGMLAAGILGPVRMGLEVDLEMTRKVLDNIKVMLLLEGDESEDVDEKSSHSGKPLFYAYESRDTRQEHDVK